MSTKDMKKLLYKKNSIYSKGFFLLNEEGINLINELQRLVLKVNLETDYCVFLENNAHIYSIDISFNLSKRNFTIKIEGNKHICLHYGFLVKDLTEKVINDKHKEIQDVLAILESMLNGSFVIPKKYEQKECEHKSVTRIEKPTNKKHFWICNKCGVTLTKTLKLVKK